MSRIAMLASVLAGLLTALPMDAYSFEASPRMFQPIAASQELLMAQSGPRFYDYDEDWWDGPDRRDRRDGRYRDCHRRADRHPGLRRLHRHVGRYCSVQFLRPVRNPRRDQYCVFVGDVRFCAG
jgi:hypothetical protein